MHAPATPLEPSKRMPVLVIIIDEYAELAEQAPDAMNDTDTIARLSRAPAVTLVAATLWGSGTRLSVLTWASMRLARTR